MQTEDIEAEINDKPIYAVNRAYEVMCEGEPAAVNRHGTVEGTKNITPQSLKKAYDRLLSTARIEIICAGCNDFTEVKTLFKEKFAGLKNRTDTVNCTSRKSPLKTNVFTKTEKLDVTQSKLVLGFKTDCDNKYALTLLNNIFGGGITSKLFVEVREKMSLCYYCNSTALIEKGILYVSSGVETANINKARTAILAEFAKIQDGGISDKEWNSALSHLQDVLKTITDKVDSVSDWYMLQIYRNENRTPEEAYNLYKTVTRKDVIEVSKTVKLDTVYVLTELGKQEAGK
jgi:predicted Zn-dependent peptidase